MLIVKINNVDLEAAQTSFAGFPHVIGFSANPAKFRFVRFAQNSELRRDDHFFAMTFYPAAEQLLVCVRPVHVRGIEKRDAELDCAMDCRDRFIIVASAVKIGHAHATESDGRNYRSAASEFALFHIKFGQPRCAARLLPSDAEWPGTPLRSTRQLPAVSHFAPNGPDVLCRRWRCARRKC